MAKGAQPADTRNCVVTNDMGHINCGLMSSSERQGIRHPRSDIDKVEDKEGSVIL